MSNDEKMTKRENGKWALYIYRNVEENVDLTKSFGEKLFLLVCWCIFFVMEDSQACLKTHIKDPLTREKENK